MRIHQYLNKDILLASVFITAALLVLLITTELSETLTKTLTGEYSSNAIWIIIGFQILILMPEIIPAAYFLAALTTLHRMSQDSERVVYHAIGISDVDITGQLLKSTAIPVMIVMIALLNTISPYANEHLISYIEAQKNRPITNIILPKSFNSLSANGITLYADDSDNASGELLDVFAVIPEKGSMTVILSEAASTLVTEGNQFLHFQDGEQRQFSFNGDNASMVENFSDLSILIDQGNSSRQKKDSISMQSMELLNSAKRPDKIELITRLSTPLYIPVFCILAVLLTRFKPRSAKAGAMALGIALYIAINFSYRTINSAFIKSDIPLIFAPWWFLVLSGGIALLILRKRT